MLKFVWGSSFREFKFGSRFLARLALGGALLVSGGISHAQDQGDSSADAPGQFGDVISKTKGVMIRVPMNASGEENTDMAEMRFYQKNGSVNRNANPSKLWGETVPAGKSDAVTGRNMPEGHDSSTWGWWNWYGLGWMYPNYYVYYYPTFYWGGWWYHYGYYWNWVYNGWNYYYFNWWY